MYSKAGRKGYIFFLTYLKKKKKDDDIQLLKSCIMSGVGTKDMQQVSVFFWFCWLQWKKQVLWAGTAVVVRPCLSQWLMCYCCVGELSLKNVIFFVAAVLAATSKDRRCGTHHPAYKEHAGGVCHLLHEPGVLAPRLLSSAESSRERKAEWRDLHEASVKLSGRPAEIKLVVEMFL